MISKICSDQNQPCNFTQHCCQALECYEQTACISLSILTDDKNFWVIVLMIVLTIFVVMGIWFFKQYVVNTLHQ